MKPNIRKMLGEYVEHLAKHNVDINGLDKRDLELFADWCDEHIDDGLSDEERLAIAVNIGNHHGVFAQADQLEAVCREIGKNLTSTDALIVMEPNDVNIDKYMVVPFSFFLSDAFSEKSEGSDD